MWYKTYPKFTNAYASYARAVSENSEDLKPTGEGTEGSTHQAYSLCACTPVENMLIRFLRFLVSECVILLSCFGYFPAFPGLYFGLFLLWIDSS